MSESVSASYITAFHHIFTRSNVHTFTRSHAHTCTRSRAPQRQKSFTQKPTRWRFQRTLTKSSQNYNIPHTFVTYSHYLYTHHQPCRRWQHEAACATPPPPCPWLQVQTSARRVWPKARSAAVACSQHACSAQRIDSGRCLAHVRPLCV